MIIMSDDGEFYISEEIGKVSGMARNGVLRMGFNERVP